MEGPGAAALVVSAVAMTVLFRARPRELPIVLLAASVSFTASRLGTLAFGAWRPAHPRRGPRRAAP